MDDVVSITDDFIEESKANLGQFRPKSRRTGPYSKHDKISRRNEVYKLYFDYGYSGRRIAEMMNVHRNTIHGDIQYWYNQISWNFNFVDPKLAIIRQIAKHETQKTRLREYLDKSENISEKITIERLILDVESKITNIRIRMGESYIQVHEKATKWLNEHMEKTGQNQRYLSIFDTRRVSKKAYDQIHKIFNDEEERGIF